MFDCVNTHSSLSYVNYLAAHHTKLKSNSERITEGEGGYYSASNSLSNKGGKERN